MMRKNQPKKLRRQSGILEAKWSIFQEERSDQLYQMELKVHMDETELTSLFNNEKSLVTLSYLLPYIQVLYRHHN